MGDAYTNLDKDVRRHEKIEEKRIKKMVDNKKLEQVKEDVKLMSRRVMAIMKNVELKYEDHNQEVCLWFDAFLDENSVAMQILPKGQYGKFLEDYEVSSIKELEGKPVWVYHDNDYVKLHGACIIK